MLLTDEAIQHRLIQGGGDIGRRRDTLEDAVHHTAIAYGAVLDEVVQTLPKDSDTPTRGIGL